MVPQVTLESAVPGIQRVCQRNAISLAYLFGSVARGTADEESDIDIGVMLPHRQFKTNTHDLHLSLIGAFADELGIDSSRVDVILLGEAPLLLQYAVVRTGRCIVGTDSKVRKSFEEAVRRRYRQNHAEIRRDTSRTLERLITLAV